MNRPLFLLAIAAVTVRVLAENRPETWFHFIDGNVSKEGIVADLDAIRDAGIGGVQFFHGGWNRGTWPDVTNPVTCLSSNWTEVVRFLADEAEKRNLKFTMQNCPGWSMSGGPWITPEKAMRNLTCDRADVESDGRTPLAVWPEPSAVRPEQDYRDVVALAFPTPAGDAARPVAVTNLFGTHPPAPVAGTSFTFDLGEPRLVRTVELGSPKEFNGRYPNCPDCRVRIEADGMAVADVPMPANTWKCKIPWSIACDETTARVWKLTFFNTRTLDARERSVRFLSGARLDNYEGQAGWTLRGLVRRPDPKQSAAAFVRRREIREVRRGDTLPRGKWTILRLGHVNTCIHNDPAPREATGWECDKLDAEIVREHFDNYIGRALRDGIRVKGVLLDSWECERQTWTAKLPELFRARNGYDFTALLPALFGYVIDTPDETRKFLLDFRGTIGNLIEENYYRTMSELAHAHGLDIRYETAFGDVIPGDTLRFWKYADEPMCEFWQPVTDGHVGSTHFKPILPCVSAAHVYGKKRVSAEAFTSFALTWNEDFNLLKPIADRYLARGVTHLVFHTYTHNPSVDPRRRPGTSFGWGIGTPFLRGQTWWPYMRDFTDYLARCQAILESGRPVVDVLRYLGDDLDIRPNDDEPFPSGYQRDYCNADALTALPADHKYRVLWISTNTFVSAATEGLIAKSGLRVIRGELKPDWPADVTTESASRDPLQWYHRQAEDGDWYFLAAWTNGWTGKVAFRAGGAAQLDLAPGESLFARIADGKLSLVDPLSGREVKREVKLKVESTPTSTPTPHTYTFTLSERKADERIVLDLGEVHSWATVKVNGREAARLWCRPYRCDISEFVRDGENEISVEVTSTWRNRLIREAALPEAKRTTWVIDGPAADAPLVPEGLLGPVRLFAR